MPQSLQRSQAERILRKKKSLTIGEWGKVDQLWRAGQPTKYACEIIYAMGLERLHAETINMAAGKTICDPASLDVLYQIPPTLLRRDWSAFAIPRESLSARVSALPPQYILLAVDPLNPGAPAMAAQEIKEQCRKIEAERARQSKATPRRRRRGAGPIQSLVRMAEALWAYKRHQRKDSPKDIGGDATTFQSGADVNSMYQRGVVLLRLAKRMLQAVKSDTWTQDFPAR